MLKGGLGNQLFQFGAALRLARGDTKKIKFFLDHLGPRKFRFPEIFPVESLPAILNNLEFQEILKRGDAKLISDVNNNPYTNQNLLDIEIDLTRQDIFLDGYFQTGRHLRQLVDFVEKLNGLDSFPIMQGQQNHISPALSVHIRLGDYRKLDVQQQIGAINFGYFDKVISEEIALGKRVVIYSDEPIEARKIFASPEIEASEEQDDLAVFRHFMLAEKLLIPNSTFSLCAAYLSNRLNTLIRPARWTRKISSDELLFGFRGKLRVVANTFFEINVA
jgi:Glycosyl transferase family 11